MGVKKNKELMAIMAKMNKKFGDNAIVIAGDNIEKLSIKKYPTPSDDINAMLCGGIAQGKILEIAGENSSGKTSLMLETMAHNQKLAREEAKRNGKDSYDFCCGLFETESSFDAEYAKSLGIDMDQFVYWDQQDMSAEEGLDMLIALVNTGKFRMLGINSVSGLLPTKEKEEEIGQANMCLTARLMSKLFRVVTAAASKHNCTLIFINQLRCTLASYGNTEDTTGGKALRFYSTARIKMNKVKMQAGDPLTIEEGVKINCSVMKNRCANMTDPYKKCTIYARYGIGIDNLATLPGLLIEYGIVEQKGAWIRLYDEETGDIATINGIECKWNGKNAFIECLKANETLLNELRNRLSLVTGGIGNVQTMSDEEIEEAKKDNASSEEIENIDKELEKEIV